MTRTIRLTLDDTLMGKLEELADFHGESCAETLRLLIRHGHFDMERFVETEFGPSFEKALPKRSKQDDKIPI